MTMSEKRAHARRLMQQEAVLADDTGAARHPVVLLDISRLGVSFTSPAPLDGGSRHVLDFKLPGAPQLHETVVQVVHSSENGVPSGYRVGARFVHILPDTTDSIAHFVSHSAPA
jgi:hypothetical protein